MDWFLDFEGPRFIWMKCYIWYQFDSRQGPCQRSRRLRPKYKRRKTNDENRVQGGSGRGALSNICKDLIPISVKRPVYGYQRAHFDTLPRAMTSFQQNAQQQPCTEQIQIHHLAHYTRIIIPAANPLVNHPNDQKSASVPVFISGERELMSAVWCGW